MKRPYETRPKDAPMNKSRWFHYDKEAGQWSWQRTEDYAFSPEFINKRIGDMTRGELLHVIAVGYHERDELARSLIAMNEGKEVSAHDIDSARRLVERYEKEAMPL